MEDASRIEAQPLSGREFSFVQHSRFDMRPIVPGLLYLAVYALLVLGVKAAGLSFAVNDYGLTAGLNIGFLAAYGIWYAPWAFVATVGGGLYLNPLPFSVQVSILYCLTISLAQIATAICLRHWTSGHHMLHVRPNDSTGLVPLPAANTLHRLCHRTPLHYTDTVDSFRAVARNHPLRNQG
jgi:hypothetical protein